MMSHDRPDAVPHDSGNAAPGLPAAPGNELSGVVGGAAVQAARIHGDVNINLRPPAASGAPAPAQLPPAPANFTNRAAELTQLDAVIADHDPVRRLSVAVISGSGGTGKTSLGAYWLHQLSARFEGGALYADLRGHQREAACPADRCAGRIPARNGYSAGADPAWPR